MPIMQEVIDLEDFERMEKGLPPKKKPKLIIPNYKPPQDRKIVLFDDIDMERFVNLNRAERKTLKNEAGIMFTGVEVEIELGEKRKRGRPPLKAEEKEPENEILSGWMPEGEWYKLFRHIRDKVDLRRFAI